MRFKLFGTEVYVSFLFFAVVAFMLCIDRTGLVIPTLVAVLIHEMGHLFAMWLNEVSPKAIHLVPASVRIVRGFAATDRNEWLIALSGPVANLAVAGTLGLNYHWFGNSTALRFAILNLILGLFNLLPVRGLDGGTLLSLAVARLTTPDTAEKTVRTVTLVLSVLTFAVAIILTIKGVFNLSAFIVAIYFLVTAILKR